ncbi:hypothetical protein L9F63_004891, partial [Diploptera punctata]
IYYNEHSHDNQNLTVICQFRSLSPSSVASDYQAWAATADLSTSPFFTFLRMFLPFELIYFLVGTFTNLCVRLLNTASLSFKTSSICLWFIMAIISSTYLRQNLKVNGCPLYFPLYLKNICSMHNFVKMMVFVHLFDVHFVLNWVIFNFSVFSAKDYLVPFNTINKFIWYIFIL